MLLLDQDNDKMLNIDELKVLLSMGGAPANQLDQYASVLMMFDLDKNGKLDLKGKQFLSNFFFCQFFNLSNNKDLIFQNLIGVERL